MNNTLNTLRAALSALGTAIDTVRNYAADTHERYAGYYPERHAQADLDVVEVEQAIAGLTTLIASMEAQPEQGCILCHGKGEYEMASAWLPGQPPQEKCMVKCNQCAQPSEPKSEPTVSVPRHVIERTLHCLNTPHQADLRLVLRDLYAAFNTPQPSEPKSEPAHDDLTIAYMSGFHAGKMAKSEPVQEPFGFFRPEPFGWTDCAETDEGAIALYEAPQARKPLTDKQCDAIQRTPQVRRLLLTYADHTDDQSAIALVRAIAQANGIEGGAA